MAADPLTPAPWVKLSPEDDAIIAEIETQKDRGAALIAAALVDERLLELIKLRLRRELTKDEKGAHADLFKPGRPLASHFARIRLGFLLQLYPFLISDLMVKINNIRNDFAHKTAPIDFENQDIKNQCAAITRTILNATWMGKLFLDEATKHVRSPRTRSFTLPNNSFQIGPTWNARDAFLQACKVILYFMAWSRDVYANEFVLIEPQGPLPDILSGKSRPATPRGTASGQRRPRQRRSSQK